jgi:hypothetical protein
VSTTLWENDAAEHWFLLPFVAASRKRGFYYTNNIIGNGWELVLVYLGYEKTRFHQAAIPAALLFPAKKCLVQYFLDLV